MQFFNLATYGSLMFPEILSALTSKTFKSLDIIIRDYERFALEGKSYPGLIYSPNKTTLGRAYLDLDEDDLKILDRFEDDLYQKEELIVDTADRKKLTAVAYVVPARNRNALSDKPWDPEEFSRGKLTRYIENCQKFRQAYLSKGSS